MSKHRSKSEKHRDRLLISDYYLKGYSQMEIGVKTNLSQSTVSKDIKILIRYWTRAQYRNIDCLQEQELARINKLEIEYWEAWERSKKIFISTSVKRHSVTSNNLDKNTPAETTTKQEDRNGDPRYLVGVQWCIDKRAAILGLNAPIKSELSGNVAMSFVDLVKAANDNK
jgi:hypothetical protein